MARFRLLLIALALWFILLFNIERPDFGDFGNIDLASMVYIIAAGASIVILMLPDLGHARQEFVFLPIILFYALVKIYISRYATLNATLIYITVTEIVALYITIWISRQVSLSVANFEEAVETAVLDQSTSRALPMSEGEQAINHELFRARRYDRPVALLYLNIVALPGMETTLSERFNLETAFRRRYIQVRVAQAVEAVIYRTDIVVWHNANLVFFLPETTYDQAALVAHKIHVLLKTRLNIELSIGIAIFPEDALIYPDLVEIAQRRAAPVEDRDSDAGGSGAPPVESEPAPPVMESAPSSSNPIKFVWNLFFGAPHLLPQTRMTQEISLAAVSSKSVDPGFWVNRLPYQSASARLFYRQIKRATDLLLMTLAGPFVLPALAFIALAIYLDSGRPIFFVQYRTGLGGRRFKMYKFRTMVPNAEEMLRDLAAQGLAKLDNEGKLAEPLKLERDPRITRVGRILRKTSLDELPQLHNVFRGDMSLVGPRPTSWNVDSYTLLQTERLNVRPGITGLWQVYSRGTTDFDTWLEWDMKYIEKMSFWLDAQILARTFTKVLARTGAR